MQNDYEILGLATGAGQNEVKRAYFKLVRQFSPEKDPERFQEIRGAYERLMQTASMKDKATELRLEMPDNPYAKAACNEIEMLIGQREYKKASGAAERAISIFGECEAFLYLLAYSQRLNGHCGKAIKNYEKLVKQYPGKNIHKRGLAFAYYDRGFLNKALTAFEDAYESGVRDTDFILQFSLCCRDRDKYYRGIDILIKMVRNFDSTVKGQAEDYIEAYMGLFTMNLFTGCSYFKEIIQLYAGFIKTAGKFLKKCDEDVLSLVFVIVMTMPDNDCLPYVEEALKETEKNFPKEKYPEKWTAISDKLAYTRLEADSRLGKEVQWCWEAFISSYDVYDSTIIRFMQIDCKLVIIERLPEIKEEFDIIKSEYPELYAKMEDFFEQLEREDISYVKGRLLKDYDRVEKYITGGHYYELYPQNRPELEKLQWNSSEDGAFIRNGKKIGRNDPCPCGSGKKYKQCCGRNNK